ncbi:MAG: hypothetical protein JWM32_3276 [Verrucomicrobia bacterium]|nr:hypothetical protein [Verrucomicrobiota bacterium]
MTKVSLRFFRLATLALLSMGWARAELPIIAKARAFVGPEDALTAVKSIHYSGSLVTPDPTDPKKMTFVTIEIIVQAPFQQRIVASSDRSIEVTGLDGYDAWHKVQDPKDSTKWKLQLVGPDPIKKLRANTWENLAFYRGLEREGGKVIDQGTVKIDGISCRKIAFVHDNSNIFFRYFDDETGRLVLTENEAGIGIREQGEIRVNGLRFPKSITTTSNGRDGKPQTVTLTFDKVSVNESFPTSTFTIPALNGR